MVMRLLSVVLSCWLCITGALAAESTLRVGVNILPPGFANPYRTTAPPSITTTSALFDGLTRLDQQGNVSPWLATRWEVLDETTWRFYLRDDVVFSNHVPFDAQAVVDAVAYLAGEGPPLESVRRDMPWLVEAIAIDTHVVDIKTAVPVPIFDRHAANLLMTEPSAFNSLGAEGYAQTPAVTGPFVVREWQTNRVLLDANPTSWRPPKIKEIEIVAVPDGTARVQAVLSGRMDVAIAIGPDEAEQIAASGGSFLSFSTGQIANVTFNSLSESPFQDVRVRRALNMAVNREVLVEVLTAGQSTPANQPATRTTLGYDPSLPPFPYDPQRAKQLLEEAGYPNGFSFKLRTAFAGPGQGSVYQQAASDLRKIGVEMIFDVVPPSQFLSDLRRLADIAEAFTLPIPFFPTMDSMRAMAFHSCQMAIPWYCDRSIQPVIEKALTEWDMEKAVELRRDVMRHYHDQAPVLYLHEAMTFVGLSGRVRNYNDVFGFVDYDAVEFAP